MNLELARDQLMIVNSSNAFWKALDSSFSKASCSHDHGKGEEHFHMAGNFLIAQKKISEAIDAVFGENFDVKNEQHRDQLFVLAALQKAQDQLSGGNDFVSQRTSEFNKHFKISDSLAGKNIGGAIVAMPDAKKYLVQKFNLGSTKAKAEVILASQEGALTKAGKLVDLGFKDAVDPLVEVAGSVYKAAPSLAVAGLSLGTAQMVLRSFGDQETANRLRDNIGASTEAAAFFVLVNGALENLSHSFILAAPAFATVATYDLAHSKLKPIYDYFFNSVGLENSLSNQDLPVQEIELENLENAAEEQFATTFEPKDFRKTIGLLKKAKSLLSEDEMWIGLRKRQLAHEDNDLERDLPNRLKFLIANLEKKPEQITKLSQANYSQTLRDSFEMLKAFAEVYESKNPASGVRQFVDEFCDHFSRDAILLTEASKNAKEAAFYCKSHNGLVSFEERIRESLPHMPTGQEVLLAATVIGALYSASAIYKSATGEKEAYSDYVTNFPDHLFEWLQLDQMYQNMGGGAEITESFKDFFAKFNLAENSTHLGIALAPFALYSQKGSKMFDDIAHASANYLAYAADLTKSHATAIEVVLSGWLGRKNVAASNVEFEVATNAENGSEIDQVFIDQSTQTDLPAAEEKAKKPAAEEEKVNLATPGAFGRPENSIA